MTQATTKQNNILVVDDTHENLRLLTNMLTKYGYLVRPAPDGTLALLSAQKSPPDLILLDIMMPKMSGYEVCKHLKADERTRDIPVIFLSALHDVFDKIKAFGVGGVDYITKPFQAEEIIARVKTHLDLRNMQKTLQEQNIQLQQEISERERAEEALKESMMQIEQVKQEWESTVDSFSYVVCLLDNQGRIIRANRTVEQWNLGLITDVKGRDMHELFHPDCTDPACYLKTFLPYALEEVAQGISIGCENRDHLLQRYVSVQIRPISIQTNRKRRLSVSFAVGLVSDITERKWAEEVLQQRNHELTLLNQMSELLQKRHTEEETYNVVISVCQQLCPSSAGYLAIVDASRTRLNKVASWGSLPTNSQAFGVNDCWAFRHGKIHVLEHPHTGTLCPHLETFPDNGYLCVPIKVRDEVLGVLSLYFGRQDSYTFDKRGKYALESKWMVVSRITEHYALSLANLRLRETMRIEAIRDPLTDLYNRRYMEESLKREIRRAERNHTPVGIMMIDIDHFKIFNDTHGHKAGDVVLQALGELLRRNIRGEDIACRYGGEEFLLILPDANLGVTKARADALLSQIRKLKIPYQDAIFQVTVSIGVSAFSEASDIQEVINAADKALYQAKKQGRNQVVVALL
jgi:diguanylate cyclase (GGDEF)-like protein